jgi:DNA modification methylase
MTGTSKSCFIENDGKCIVPSENDLTGIFKRGGDARSHYIHLYPAKLIPAIPRFFINNFTKPGDIVLDPFCGSGTTVLEAKLAGRVGACTDVMPVSLLVSKVKTTHVPGDKLKQSRNDMIARIDADIKSGVDPSRPPVPNIDFWFTPKVQRELSIIRKNVDSVNDKDVKDFFRVAFSGIVKKASKAKAGDILSRIDKNYKEKDAIAIFKDKLDRNIQANEELGKSSLPTIVARASADKLPFSDNSIDAIITDPPYSTWSIPYVEVFKNEMYWSGLIDEHATIKKENWGEDKVVSCSRDDTGVESIKEAYDMLEGTDRDYKKCRFMNFANNMKNAFDEFHRVIKPGGKFIIRVGNPTSKINGSWREMPNDKIFEEIGKQSGFSLDKKFAKSYVGGALATTRNVNANAIRAEHFFIFKK